ncbi:hypothetical protein CHS0354_001417 [Potamilus streckersoni]|uniref:Hexosyltransferase n=1 Tax=Potamilus streckersoni TaxID=2493646 RepID=A0AAE0T8T3_9BIVA|nr:hypothetical protein CHS0354_001417 [Potamilus streckersoni]
MADKTKTTMYGTVKVFLWILFFLFFVVVVSVCATSNKLMYICSIHATIKSNLQDIFTGILLRNTSLNVTLNGTLNVITEPTTMDRTRSVASRIVSKAPTNLQTPRPDACEDCFSHNFKYVIDNDVTCKLYNNSQEIDLIIFIFTTHQRQQERNAIRQTWLKYTNKNTGNVRYSFLLGEVPDENVRNLVEMENKIHSDIIKEDFVDTYRNLTYKTMMAFKYSITKCSHAKYVLKTDDDMWVNIPGLLKVIQREKKTLQTAVGGACHPVAGPIRNPSSKWYASYQSYPHNSYPGFCSGTGKLFGGQLRFKFSRPESLRGRRK